jgi:hypothetical protein
VFSPLRGGAPYHVCNCPFRIPRQLAFSPRVESSGAENVRNIGSGPWELAAARAIRAQASLSTHWLAQEPSRQAQHSLQRADLLQARLETSHAWSALLTAHEAGAMRTRRSWHVRSAFLASASGGELP